MEHYAAHVDTRDRFLNCRRWARKRSSASASGRGIFEPTDLRVLSVLCGEAECREL